MQVKFFAAIRFLYIPLLEFIHSSYWRQLSVILLPFLCALIAINADLASLEMSNSGADAFESTCAVDFSAYRQQ
ncbi:MAG: hypothetical protein MJK10_14280 [Pseudomonadales bacterium]|nr:hypothetical protein [Pseudomonadales bacterium]NRA17049.1 hypothetical protein [Oceanospirillaceae bacterium]